MDTNTLKDRLSNFCTGGNAHNVGKAKFYLDNWSNKENRKEDLEKLKELLFDAMETNDWRKVKKFLKPLW